MVSALQAMIYDYRELLLVLLILPHQIIISLCNPVVVLFLLFIICSMLVCLVGGIHLFLLLQCVSRSDQFVDLQSSDRKRGELACVIVFPQ